MNRILIIAVAIVTVLSWFTLGWFDWLLVMLGVVILLNALVITPPYHFDVLSIMGERIRGEAGVLREGPHLTIPFISSIERTSMELVKNPVEFEFTTQDKVHLKVSGVFQYRADPNVLHPHGHVDAGRNVFVTVSRQVITDGVAEALKARIGAIGGTHTHDAFVANRPALGDIVNGVLRLARPAHIMHKKGAPVPDTTNTGTWANPNWSFCGRADCEFDGEVNADQLITFYTFHWPEIRKINANERALMDSRSEIENRYGIDAEAFDLGNVDFTQDTQNALEQKKQADARAEAANKRLEIAGRWKNEVGVSPQTAADQADMIMDPKVSKTIVSVQGEGGVLAGALAALAKKAKE